MAALKFEHRIRECGSFWVFAILDNEELNVIRKLKHKSFQTPTLCKEL